MKEYKFGFILIGLIAALLAFGSWHFWRDKSLSLVAIARSEADLRKSEEDYARKKTEFARVDKDYKEAEKFAGLWRGHVDNVRRSGSEMANELVTIANTLSDGSQGIACDITTTREVFNEGVGGQQFRGWTFAVQVRGSYRLAMQWLGLVEQTFPLLRVKSLQIRAEASSVFMTADLMTPVFNLSKPVETKPASKPGEGGKNI